MFIYSESYHLMMIKSLEKILNKIARKLIKAENLETFVQQYPDESIKKLISNQLKEQKAYIVRDYYVNELLKLYEETKDFSGGAYFAKEMGLEELSKKFYIKAYEEYKKEGVAGLAIVTAYHSGMPWLIKQARKEYIAEIFNRGYDLEKSIELTTENNPDLAQELYIAATNYFEERKKYDKAMIYAKKAGLDEKVTELSERIKLNY